MKDILRRKQEIESALRRYGERSGVETRLLAASKAAGEEELRVLLEAGHRLFGENRVQEAQEKWAPLKEAFGDAELHMIGHLQTNKALEACRLFDVIETLDREKLALGLHRAGEKCGRLPRLLIEVNIGAEPQKSGVFPQALEAFLSRCRAIGLSPEGLMCIPPRGADPSPHFALLKKMAKNHGLSTLSFGMSADYKIAALLGASYVRVGRALFGAPQEEK